MVVGATRVFTAPRSQYVWTVLHERRSSERNEDLSARAFRRRVKVHPSNSFGFTYKSANICLVFSQDVNMERGGVVQR